MQLHPLALYLAAGRFEQLDLKPVEMVLEILDDTRCQTQKLCQDQSLHLSCLAEEQVLLKDLIRHILCSVVKPARRWISEKS